MLIRLILIKKQKKMYIISLTKQHVRLHIDVCKMFDPLIMKCEVVFLYEV